MEPLPAWTGITIDGQIADTIAPVDIASPPLPERRPDHRLELAIAVAVLGRARFRRCVHVGTRRGRNEVFAGGAADAASATCHRRTSTAHRSPAAPTMLVADDKLDDLATIEFVPPKGLQPWEGAVLLDEKLDDGTVQCGCPDSPVVRRSRSTTAPTRSRSAAADAEASSTPRTGRCSTT